MKIVEEITLNKSGGAGFGGKKDESAELADMKWAEKFVMNKEFLDFAASLKIAFKEGSVLKGGFIMADKSDFPEYFKDGDEGINGICHRINKVFVASGLPLYATSYASDNAEKTTVERKRGKNVGKVVKQTIADQVRIYRISDTFEINRYACDDSVKVKDEGITNYHQPTEGMYLREQKWLHEHAIEMKDTLEVLGYKE